MSDFRYIKNGDLVLIEVAPTVWKVPATHLRWAKAQWPVFARELPPLKGQTTPRYAIYKNTDDGEVALHRIFVHAEPGEGVAASDGDFTNFGLVPAVVISRPKYDDSGMALLPGISDPSNPVREERRLVPNLYRIASADNPHARRNRTQRDFENNLLPELYNDANELVETPLRVRLDDGLRAGKFGKVVKPGRFAPLSDADYDAAIDAGCSTAVRDTPATPEPREWDAAAEIEALRRKWNVKAFGPSRWAWK